MTGVIAAADQVVPRTPIQLFSDAMRGDDTSEARKRALAGGLRPPAKKGRPTNAERIAREVAASAASRTEAAGPC